MLIAMIQLLEKWLVNNSDHLQIVLLLIICSEIL
nr:MAG TPA_asm: hypothetical protein [Caudoviricetes sp.]DAW98439.1 MAG TPA: hypothetical protein [Bacteriophage sp.]